MRELEDARYKAIGARIRDVRIEKNMSQAELAEKAFISVPHMSEVENGKTKLRLSTFVYITEALQVSADVLLRPNTPEVNGIYQGEFKDLLADCSPAEIDSIMETSKFFWRFLLCKSITSFSDRESAPSGQRKVSPKWSLQNESIALRRT